MNVGALGEQARRLMLASGLTRRAVLELGATEIPADAGEAALLALARRLADRGPRIERAHGVRFDPPYPGSSAGVERTAGGGLRLVLACVVLVEEAPLGVAYTMLIAARAPQVGVAPPGPTIPPGWKPLLIDQPGARVGPPQDS